VTNSGATDGATSACWPWGTVIRTLYRLHPVNFPPRWAGEHKTAVEAANAIGMIAEKNIVDGFVVVVIYDGGSESRKGYWSCVTKLNLGTNEEDGASLYRHHPSKIAVLAQDQVRVKARREMIERNQFRTQNSVHLAVQDSVGAPSRTSLG
jgi:hypothetical protein